MTAVTQDQADSRQRTLLVALLLSAWGPLATGLAVYTGRSTTQLADFLRRSVELVALFVSWYAFRSVQRTAMPSAHKARLERKAALTVAGAMASSGLVMLVITLTRLRTFQPGGNVYPGLAIAGLGLLTHAWFWQRYARFDRESHNPIMAVQRELYRAKSSVDLCVMAALLAVALAPHAPVTRYLDLVGSVAVALYMLWSAVNAVRAT